MITIERADRSGGPAELRRVRSEARTDLFDLRGVTR